jgi:hypothetical protein
MVRLTYYNSPTSLNSGILLPDFMLLDVKKPVIRKISGGHCLVN